MKPATLLAEILTHLAGRDGVGITADKLGVSREALRRMVAGGAPSIATAQAVAAALDVPAWRPYAWFFSQPNGTARDLIDPHAAGGRARARKLPAERRREIARLAAAARWTCGTTNTKETA